MNENMLKMNAERYTSLLKQIKREGIEDLINYFYENRFFELAVRPEEGNSFPGNIITHSLSVYDTAKKMNLMFHMDLDEDSLIIVCLLHDVCLIDIENRFPVGHAEKSIFIIQRFIKLTNEEIMAINSHMGSYDLRITDYKNFACAFDNCPLALCLYLSDTLSASYLETKLFK